MFVKVIEIELGLFVSTFKVGIWYVSILFDYEGNQMDKTYVWSIWQLSQSRFSNLSLSYCEFSLFRLIQLLLVKI